MLLLLLIAQASAEWVEISQQHYKKPIRHPFITPDKTYEESTSIWNYDNRSVLDNNWNKPITYNNRKEHHAQTGAIENLEKYKFQDEDSPAPGEDRNNFEYKSVIGESKNDFNYQSNYGPSKEIIKEMASGKPKGEIEKVPNIGNVRRVQLNNTPVKSPILNFKLEKEKNLTQYNNDQFNYGPTEANKPQEYNKKQIPIRRIYINEINRQYSTERANTFPVDDEYIDSFTEEVEVTNKNNYKLGYSNYTTAKNILPPKPTFITETEEFGDFHKETKRLYKITDSKIGITERTNIITTVMVDLVDEDLVPKNIIEYTERPTSELKNIASKVSHAVPANTNDYTENKEHKEEKDSLASVKTRINLESTNIKQPGVKFTTEKELPKGNYIKGGTENKAKLDPKGKTLENVLKFMKVVADTISKNSRKSFGGKVQYLNELRDSILANIEERIDSAWPDDLAPSQRHTRSAEARGHVQLPSSESALMTISFLTFAVFLIKLVLQVIQTYKHKSMMVAPLVVSSGRAAFTQRGQA